MKNLGLTICFGVVIAATALGLAQNPPSATAGSTETGASASQAPAAPDSPMYSTPGPQEGGTTDGMIAPDTRPLSGAQPFTLGISGQKQATVSFHASQAWDSNPQVQAGETSTDFQTLTSLGGSLSLQRQSRSSQTALLYSGNLLYYSKNQPSTTTLQNLNFSQNFQVGRWSFATADSFNYVPNSLLGLTFALPIPDVSSSAIKPQYAPDQSILNPYGAQYSNTVMGQGGYAVSRRASVTLSGTYGFVKFQDLALYDFNQASGNAGYNYSANAKDSIAVSYNYSLYRYESFNSEFHSQSVQFSYGRKVTGRMSLQAGGGPQFINSAGLAAASGNRVTYTANAALSYQRLRDSISVGYVTGSTAGAGVLFGATTTTLQMSVVRAVTKTWSATGAFGFSRNTGLTNSSQLYQGVFVAANARRALGRYAGLGFNYSYQRQIADNCSGFVCGDVNRTIAGVSFDWSFRPIRLE